MKKAIVLGAGGFIGSHLVKKLKEEGYWVRGVDLKYPEFGSTLADDFVIGDLREKELVRKVIPEDVDELYQLSADMGGAGYVFSGEHDANIMYNSAMINLNVALECLFKKVKKLFFSSSACMYPQEIQETPDNKGLAENMAYPANPDSEYGWEKLFSERLYLAFNRNWKLNVRIARFHNIFGPHGTWEGGKEKAPAAICRKVIAAPDVTNPEDFSSIEIWGDGKQTRSFLYIDECIEGIRRLMEQDEFLGPVNIGSEEMISINDFAKMVIDISGKSLIVKNIEGPLGVRGRNSDNTLIKEKLGWAPSQPLREGVEKTYKWIKEEYGKNEQQGRGF